MDVDFTPLMGLIIAIIPILLLLSVLGYFIGKRGFGMSNQVAIRRITMISIVLAMVFSLGLAAPFMLTQATASLSPSSGTLATDIPNYFTARGLTADTAYSINVTVGGSETVAVSSITSSSTGTLSFSLTFLVEGSTNVEVITGGSAAVTGTYNVVNLINIIMPYIILIVTLSLVFGVAGMVTKMIKVR